MKIDFINDLKVHSKWYTILKFFVDGAHNQFYEKIIITGRENIPENEAVILTPNHQNALMDALCVLGTKRYWQPVFIGRSDIFKNKYNAKILTFFKVLPIFRMRDGVDIKKENKVIFDKAVEVLQNGNPLVLFPEGTHTNKRRLQPLKKGFARIAFQAAQRSGFETKIKLVPVGIYYSNFPNFRTILQLNYGQPIEISKYYDLYQENMNQAFNELRDELTDAIKPLIIDIQDINFYDAFEVVREVYDTQMLRNLSLKTGVQTHKFKADQKTVAVLAHYKKNHEEKAEQLKTNALQYQHKLKQLNIRDWVFEKSPFNIGGLLLRLLLFIVLLPVALYGTLHHILGILFINGFLKRVKDIQFYSSFKFVLGTFIVFPILYLVFFISSLFVFEAWWHSLIYVLSLPFSGLFLHYYYRHWVKWRAKWIFTIRSMKKDIRIQELHDLRRQITDSVDEAYQEVTSENKNLKTA